MVLLVVYCLLVIFGTERKVVRTIKNATRVRVVKVTQAKIVPTVHP